jgi:hypothetical protein
MFLKRDEHGTAKVLVALAYLPTERCIDPVVARQARETALHLTGRLTRDLCAIAGAKRRS